MRAGGLQLRAHAGIVDTMLDLLRELPDFAGPLVSLLEGVDLAALFEPLADRIVTTVETFFANTLDPTVGGLAAALLADTRIDAIDAGPRDGGDTLQVDFAYREDATRSGLPLQLGDTLGELAAGAERRHVEGAWRRIRELA